jgi:hypothetical protein
VTDILGKQLPLPSWRILSFALRLGKLGFHTAMDQRPHAEYCDFERYVHGFGNDPKRDDRIETISLNTQTGEFYGTARHNDESGENWYDFSTHEATVHTIEEVDAQLIANRKVAPRFNDLPPTLEMVEHMMQIAEDTKKHFTFEKHRGTWAWVDRDEQFNSESYHRDFTTFVAALRDAVEPYL